MLTVCHKMYKIHNMYLRNYSYEIKNSVSVSCTHDCNALILQVQDSADILILYIG